MNRAQASERAGVLIVIPCLNEERHLPGLLSQLETVPPDWLIVVADGGSSDRSRAIVNEAAARRPNVRLLDNPRRIQSAGVNLAAARFGEGVRWLIRIDAHCRYPDAYAQGLVQTAERTAASSVVVPMITQGQACFQKACAAAQNSVLGAGGAAHRKVGAAQFVDHGHHALFDLAAYAGVGGYDESFSHNEDAELDLRLARAGARVWLEPSLAIVYFPRSAPGPLFRQYYNYGKGRARTIQRHRTRLKARQAAPLAIAPVVLAAVAGPWFWPVVLPAAAWAAACLAYGVVLSGKARSICVLLSGPAAMIMHFAWSLGFWRQALLGARPGPEPQALHQGVGEGVVVR